MSSKLPANLDRFLRSQEIAAAPEKYAVCTLCESIVTASTQLCPNCHGYRMDPDPRLVISRALVLGHREQSTVTLADLR